MLDILTEGDKCCDRAFAKAQPEQNVWTCPKCGQEYRAEMTGEARHWTAYVWSEVVR